MDASNTQALTVDEALGRADDALQNGDINLASALYNAVVDHDHTNPVASYGKHKIEFLLNELTGVKNPYTSALRNQSVNSLEGANAAIEALDRALESVTSQRESNEAFKAKYTSTHDSKTSSATDFDTSLSDLDKSEISKKNIGDFDREGFCVAKNVISPNLVSMLKSSAKAAIQLSETIFEQSSADRVGMHVRDQFYVFFNPSNHFPELLNINFSGDLMDSVRNLLGPNSYLIHDQFTIKNPMRSDNPGGVFSWHQDRYDSELAVSTHDPFLTCLIPIHRMNHENGGLRVVPFSNFPESANPLQHFQGSIREQVENHAVTISCDVGDAVFWSSNTLHSSLPNLSASEARWVYIVQFSNAPLAMADRNNCAMRAGQIVGERSIDSAKPLLHGVPNPW